MDEVKKPAAKYPSGVEKPGTSIDPDPGLSRQAETTVLSPLEEALFQAWGRANGIEDVDSPESAYDYRGFFKETNGKVHPPGAVEHFPDTYKQHGHPTFSSESKYSKGMWDGGMWVPQPINRDGLAIGHDQSTLVQPPKPMRGSNDAQDPLSVLRQLIGKR